MKLEAVLHIPMSEYCHGLDEKHIVYRLRTARGDIKRVTLYYADTACRVNPIVFTPEEMAIVASDSRHDYWEVIADSLYNRIYYYFWLDDGKETKLYYGDLFTDVLAEDRSEYFKLPFVHRADLAVVPDWAKDAVVYNIFPDSFATSRRWISKLPVQKQHEGHTVNGRLGGTLKGIADNVDYLAELGINCIYLNPIFAAGEYHKYDLLDYYHVDPCFGGNEAFRELIRVLHSRGIRVIIDGVFNHCGWYFFAFDDVIKNQEKSSYCRWFYQLEFPVTRPETPEEFPGYACFAYERMMPKLDTSQPEVRDYFCRVGEYWIKEYGIDGWRLDVASEVDDGFWRAFRRAVKNANPEALLIGEVWESANHWLQGDMFDSAMNYDFRKHCSLFFAKGSIDAQEFAGRITHMLMRYKVPITPAQLNLLDSHDVARFLSLCGGSVNRYKLAVLFMMTFIGMPTVFYGDELGAAGIREEEYRQPMPWEEGDGSLFKYFQEVIKLRKEYAALRRGSFRTLNADSGSSLLVYQRIYDTETVTIALNGGKDAVLLEKAYGRIVMESRHCDGVLNSFGFCVYEL